MNRGQENGVASAHVVHVLSPKVPSDRLGVLRALLDGPGEGQCAAVVQVGGGRLPGGAARVARVTAPLGVPWLAAGRLRRAVDSLRSGEGGTAATGDGSVKPAVGWAGGDPADEGNPRIVLHAWSAEALRWCLPIADERHALLVQADMADDFQRLARWFRSRDGDAAVGFICPTALARRRLAEQGVPPRQCVVIREFVDFGLINRARPAGVRDALGLAAGEKVLLALPPIVRRAGHFTGVWAALLAQVVRGDLRLVIPGETNEARRLGRLMNGVGFGSIARFCGDRYTLPELLSAADLAVYVPPGDAPVSSLAWAMAAGVPIVASAVPAVAELLADRQNAWLCRPGEPRAAARTILHALENPDASRELAALARSQAYEVFSRQRMLDQYRRVYANAATGREIAADIADAVVA